jgi:uncharacterized membrane-anchored protein
MAIHRWSVPAGVLAFAALAAHAAPASGPEAGADAADSRRQQLSQLPWQKGPGSGAVGTHAHLAIPDDSGLLPEANGGRFLELTGNLPQPGITILARNGWFAAFSFDESGYVKDDEKLDPDALLATLKQHEESSNEERRKRGLAQLTTDGWIVPPHYDSGTKFLEWGVKLHASDSPDPVVNYSMRLLARKGYETVVLVTSPETLDRDVKDLHGVLGGFDFDAGEKYSEFRPGDHVAEFGLGALVLGGAAAAAVKAGWFKGLLVALAAAWKFVLAAVVAGFAAVGKLVARLRGTKAGS